MPEQLSRQLAAAEPLTEEQVCRAVEQLADEAVPVADKAEFLASLARKGETAEEIGAFARALHARCVQPVLDEATRAREILDVVGTGGDRLSTFNISTTVSGRAFALGADDRGGVLPGAGAEVRRDRARGFSLAGGAAGVRAGRQMGRDG